jgi:hypothetical protein
VQNTGEIGEGHQMNSGFSAQRTTRSATASNRFGEQVTRIEFQGFDNLEEAQAFCALDVKRALHDDAEPPETP